MCSVFCFKFHDLWFLLSLTLFADPKKRVFDKDHPFLTEIENLRELNDEGCDRGCIHADVKLPKGARYEEGDHIALYPCNLPSLVAEYCAYFNVDPKLKCAIYGNTDKDKGKLLFGPFTVGGALSIMVDLQERPRKSVLEKLLHYAKEPEQGMFSFLYRRWSKCFWSRKWFETFLGQDSVC